MLKLRERFRNWLFRDCAFPIVNKTYYTYTQVSDSDILLEKFNSLSNNVKNLMNENEQLKLMYEDIQKDVQPLHRVVETLRSI